VNGKLVKEARYHVRQALNLSTKCHPNGILHDAIREAIIKHLIQATALFGASRAGRKK